MKLQLLRPACQLPRSELKNFSSCTQITLTARLPKNFSPPRSPLFSCTQIPIQTLKELNQKMAAVVSSLSPSGDRLLALKEFDESKSGVKGLVDSGITSLPPFFIHPNLNFSSCSHQVSIPIVDLSLPRPAVVDQIRSAAGSFGFFHVINHSIPLSLLDRTITAVRSFHGLPIETRSQYYSRQFQGGVSYATNFDLFRSAAASWRDTIQIQLGPARPDPAQIHEVCRGELMSLEQHARDVGREVMGILAEGLGVERERFEGMSCGQGSMMVCHYYPWCPEPERTVGLTEHTDPGVVTVLVQDKVGGLQVKWNGAWVDVDPVEGAVVINVGDLMQIMSNNEYKSVVHRVVANSHEEGRVSIGVFFNPGRRGESDYYGPLPELVSQEKPAIYRNFTMAEFMGTFANKGLASKCLVDYFKL